MVGDLLNVISAEGYVGVTASNTGTSGGASLNDINFAGLDVLGRRVYLAYCDKFESIATLVPPASPFVLFLGGDSAPLNIDQISAVAQHVLAAGAVYLVCWGRDAVRCEEIVDETSVHTALDDHHPTIMTTSHDGESLLEALEFATTVAVPVSEYQDSCKTVLVVIADNIRWYNEAQNCLEELLNHGTA